LVLTANHPSPLSAMRPPEPFIGCGHFIKANEFLAIHSLPLVDFANH
jgi:uracil-DNA glycosylase